MRKKIFYLIGSCAFLCILFSSMQNYGIIPYRKTIRADYENNKLLFYKFRTAEMFGLNLKTDANLSIFIKAAIRVDYCICGSEGWNNYTDEKKLKNILRRKFSVFYY